MKLDVWWHCVCVSVNIFAGIRSNTCFKGATEALKGFLRLYWNTGIFVLTCHPTLLISDFKQRSYILKSKQI